MALDLTLPGTRTVVVKKQDGGYVAEGRGFYIWDEDLDEVTRLAKALSKGDDRARPTARTLILERGQRI